MEKKRAFSELAPGRRRAPRAPKQCLFEGASPNLRRGTRAGRWVAQRLGAPFTIMIPRLVNIILCLQSSKKRGDAMLQKQKK